MPLTTPKRGACFAWGKIRIAQKLHGCMPQKLRYCWLGAAEIIGDE
jgi:hypothetical protein